MVRENITGGELRHGWGGNKKLREQAMRYIGEETVERPTNPLKWGETNEPVDYELLELMNRKKDSANDE